MPKKGPLFTIPENAEYLKGWPMTQIIGDKRLAPLFVPECQKRAAAQRLATLCPLSFEVEQSPLFLLVGFGRGVQPIYNRTTCRMGCAGVDGKCDGDQKTLGIKSFFILDELIGHPKIAAIAPPAYTLSHLCRVCRGAEDGTSQPVKALEKAKEVATGDMLPDTLRYPSRAWRSTTEWAAYHSVYAQDFAAFCQVCFVVELRDAVLMLG
jgi:hypothetical protein